MNYTTTCALCASMFTGSKAECKARKCRQCLQLEKRTGAVAIVPDSEPTGIEAAVCADITARQQLGIRKYGCTVAESKDDMLRHALEESYDLAVYLRAEIERRKAQGWQPISSAPKDGTHVLGALLWRDEYTQAVIYWTANCWQLAETGGNATDGDPDGTLTHWHQLPNPPPHPVD